MEMKRNRGEISQAREREEKQQMNLINYGKVYFKGLFMFDSLQLLLDSTKKRD